MSKIGLALAGGGLEGAVYEIGVLRALDDILEGVDLNDLEICVGVSAGAYVSACLANGIHPADLCRAIRYPDPATHPFRPEIFFTPAVGHYLRGGLRVPGLLLDSLRDLLERPEDAAALASFSRLARALPVGLFRNEPIRRHLHELFSRGGRTDDFRELRRRLVLVAVDLDSGEAVRFGEPGHDDVPISRAVQASTALPGLYPPVSIGDRHYVDGVLLKTLHASVALEADVDLLICVNPIVPVDTVHAVDEGVMRRGRLANRGLLTVMSQAFRTLIYSRLQTGMAAYAPRFPDKEVLLIEPSRVDYRMFFTNIFRLSSRRAICEHAYRTTRSFFLERAGELGPQLARHGIRLRRSVLCDESRGPWHGVDPGPQAPVTERLGSILDRIEESLGAPRGPVDRPA